jgi:hypothetical protein
MDLNPRARGPFVAIRKSLCERGLRRFCFSCDFPRAFYR